MRLGDGVVHKAPFFLWRQKPAPLHQPQMLRRHVAGDLACVGEFANRKAPLQQHLHDSQPVRMGECPQALGRLGQRFEFSQFQSCFSRHQLFSDSIISGYINMSNQCFSLWESPFVGNLFVAFYVKAVAARTYKFRVLFEPPAAVSGAYRVSEANSEEEHCSCDNRQHFRAT